MPASNTSSAQATHYTSADRGILGSAATINQNMVRELANLKAKAHDLERDVRLLRSDWKKQNKAWSSLKEKVVALREEKKEAIEWNDDAFRQIQTLEEQITLLENMIEHEEGMNLGAREELECVEDDLANTRMDRLRLEDELEDEKIDCQHAWDEIYELAPRVKDLKGGC
ncbi:hypothetical protein JAAARDRAFT_51544 [Jaapia argillacea MUCL 33604]|uniref:Uncharacterized protein n=1 Tax=Jaapia argillacea MUCL 33604 TaxID=933084 RepID=A0A067PFT7_9AGAM|nr:hypothetical protein JAAARDRAFT_51544 [Jaapia argillacea MUCL 33604]